MRSKLLLILFLFPAFLSAQEIGEDCLPTRPDRLVNDYADVLSDADEQKLEKRLVSFNKETSNQIVIVTTGDLCGYDASMYSFKLGEKWGVGQKEFDNGVVIMIKPTGGTGDRHAFIATGYGLEGAIPDATAKMIVEAEMIPQFRKNDFYKGLNNAVDVVTDLAQGEYDHKQYAKKQQPEAPWFVFLVPLLIIGLIGYSFFSRARRYSRLNDVSLWTSLFLISQMGRSHGGSFGHFGSGGGGFGGGGFGGGGFGGFGGGGFGGGGAGGSW